MQYTIISNTQSVLGEGISLRPNTSEISWVDITENQVHWKNWESGEMGSLSDFESPSCTFSDGKSGIFVSHLGGIAWLDRNYRNSKSCTSWFTKDSGLRCNDGKMDAAGNIWISTMSVSHLEHQGAIWFWDRKSKPTLVVDNLTIPNSIAVDEMRNRLYFADSHEGVIYSAQLATNRDSIISTREFYRSDSGVPDGSTLDLEGNLWNTRWDGSAIHKISPSGIVEYEFSTPFERPTSCTFGADSGELFVTSAAKQGDSLGGHTVRICI